MTPRRPVTRLSFAALAVVAAAAITGCGMMKPSSMPSESAQSSQAAQSNRVAFSTQMRASSEVPPNASQGSGMVDAVFDKNTNLLRWKANFSGLTGPATMAHFHGPAAEGAGSRPDGRTLVCQRPHGGASGRRNTRPDDAALLMVGQSSY